MLVCVYSHPAYLVVGQKLSSARCRASERRTKRRASERGESEDLLGEEEKEDAISEVVRSVYRVA